MGAGFAIPSGLARSIAEQLIDSGEVVRGFLGVVIQDLTSELAESFDIEQSRGALIAQVTADSPAQKAGLKAGDVIVSYQGKPVKDIGSFRNRVSQTPPDSRAKLTVIRDGERREIDVTIGRLDDAQLTAEAPAEITSELGLSVQTLTPQLAQQFDAKAGQGVVVTKVEPGSVAEVAGIKIGDVILQVNRKPVDSAQAFNRAIGDSRQGKRALLLIASGDMQRYVVLSW
jgi:serine protease Do